jgi:hypothetical protein
MRLIIIRGITARYHDKDVLPFRPVDHNSSIFIELELPVRLSKLIVTFLNVLEELVLERDRPAVNVECYRRILCDLYGWNRKDSGIKECVACGAAVTVVI